MAGVDLAAGGCLRSVRADLKRGRGDDTDAAPPRAKRQQAELLTHLTALNLATAPQPLATPAATALTLWTPSLLPCAARAAQRDAEPAEATDAEMEIIGGTELLGAQGVSLPPADPLPPFQRSRYSHPFLPPNGPGPLVVYKGVPNAVAARDALVAQAAARCGLLLQPPRPLGPPALAPVVIVELPPDGEEAEAGAESQDAMALD